MSKIRRLSVELEGDTVVLKIQHGEKTTSDYLYTQRYYEFKDDSTHGRDLLDLIEKTYLMYEPK